jgi:hypothetical protein
MLVSAVAVLLQTTPQKEVITTLHITATEVIGILMLMIAFATLVIKIIEVARSR